MDTLFYSLGVLYVLHSLIQSAVPQADDDTSSDDLVCPPLSDNSVRALCQSEDGPTSCDAEAPRPGLQARLVWKKNVVPRNNKRGPNILVCDSTGVWTVETTKRKTDAPGYTVLPGFGTYKFIRFSGNLEDANTTCNKDRTRLFVVDSMAEMKAVFTKLLEPQLDAFRGVGLFLGVRQSSQGLFKTEFGDAFPGNSGIRWGNSEPSRGANEGCVFIDVPSFEAHDMPCVGHAANVVCERPIK